MKRRVVVTGMGVITPLGKEVDELWNGILEARSGIHTLSLIEPAPFKVRLAGDIPDFEQAFAALERLCAMLAPEVA